MSVIQFDVIIIGAGPAGLLSAISLARSGFRVGLIEKKQPPIDKACGEGILPIGRSILHKYGLLDLLPENQCYNFRGIRYISQAGHQSQASFKEGPGLGIRRLVLSGLLLDAAKQESNITLIFGESFKSLEIQDNLTWMETNKNQYRSHLLIGADGMRSSVSRFLGWNQPFHGRLRWGATVHFSIPPQSDYVEVHMGPGIEAYVTPCSPSLTGIAFLWHKNLFKTKSKLDLLHSLLDPFPLLAKRFSQAKQEGSIQAIGPLAQKRRQIMDDGIVLLGDASGYLDAITGEGLSLAFEEADALIEVLATSLPSAI